MGALEYKYVGDDEVVGREYFEPRKGLFLLVSILEPVTDLENVHLMRTVSSLNSQELMSRTRRPHPPTRLLAPERCQGEMVPYSELPPSMMVPPKTASAWVLQRLGTPVEDDLALHM